MKTFLVLLKEKSTKQLNQNLLYEHIEHLKQLRRSGRLLICGPFVDDSGAMLVVQSSSKSDADELVQSDPFVKNAYYGSYSITEFYKADASNNYLMEHNQTTDELNRS